MNDEQLYEAMMETSRELRAFIIEHSKLHQEIAVHQAKVDQVLADGKEDRKQLQELREWRVEVQGQLRLLKWLSAGGVAGGASMLLRLLGVPLP